MNRGKMTDAYDVATAIVDLVDEMIQAEKADIGMYDVPYYKEKLIKILKEWMDGNTPWHYHR